MLAKVRNDWNVCAGAEWWRRRPADAEERASDDDDEDEVCNSLITYV